MWSQLQEFLVSHLFSLQAYEKFRNKAHYHGKSRDEDVTDQNSCLICAGKYFVGTCTQYNNKTAQQRLELKHKLKKHKLCYNYLGRHRSLQCKSTRHCQNCAAKHHTTNSLSV